MVRTQSSPETMSSQLPPGVDRRGFLRTVAGGTAAIALASMIPGGCAADYPDAPADSLRALSPKEFSVIRAASETMIVGLPVEPEVVALRIDEQLALVGEPIVSDFKTVLTLIEHLTPLGGRLRRFTSLSADARYSYLRGWRESRFVLRRAAFQAIKSFVYFYTYCDDRTRTLTGFPGPWREVVEIPAYPVDFGEVI